MSDTQSNNPLGQDSLKGGIFFGSALTPTGTFSNVPQVTVTQPPTEEVEASLILTLGQIKSDLQTTATTLAGSAENVLSDKAVNTFLTSFVQLLIDYRDLRNFVFFGSAYTELSYHINYLLKNFPYKSFFAKDLGANAIDPTNQISITPLGGNQTQISFEFNDVLQVANYFYDISGKTSWLNYDILDVNNTRFRIKKVLFQVGQFPTTLTPSSTPIQVTIPNTVIGTVNGKVTPCTIDITTYPSVAHGLKNGDIITLNGVFNGPVGINGVHVINNVVVGVSTTTFELVGTTGNLTMSGGSIAINRVNINVDGNINSNNFIQYIPYVGSLFKGLIISPSFTTENDFLTTLDPVQKALLSFSNPVPWPRENVTNNITTSGTTFDNWTSNPQNMSMGYNLDIDGVVNDINIENILSLPSAFTLDETSTDQLLRRAIPYRLVDEIRDTEDKFFTRFIWLAGKMFDTLKVYIDFLKYTKEVNYTAFNQLSPDFYKVYAEHYGFDLFDEDNVDLAKAIIVTEPGLAYDSSHNASFTDEENTRTLKELQDEKQKRLLVNLFHLYSSKGTLKSIEALTKLLGSPEGLILFKEQLFNTSTGFTETDNGKVNVPQISYEIDPDYLVNPNNLLDPVNLPYVYRLKLDNDNLVNLRELIGHIEPQGAIQQDILRYGSTTFPYAKFSNGTFATLQNNISNYYLLPLTFPDKFCGITVEYMLPRNGFTKGTGQGYDETSLHIGSLFEVDDITYTGGVPNKILSTTQYSYELPQTFMEHVVQSVGINPIPGQSIVNRDFIIARLEGNSLVVRAKLTTENTYPTSTLTNIVSTDSSQTDGVFLPVGTKAYITDFSSNFLTVIDVINNVTKINLSAVSTGVSSKHDSSRIYVSCGNTNQVKVINTITDTIVATISVGTFPIRSAVTLDDTYVYVANANSNNISKISTTLNTVVSTISGITNPQGLAIDPTNTYLYVTHGSTNQVTIISLATDTVVGSPLSVGSNPQMIALTSGGKWGLVPCYGSGNLYIIDLTTFTVSTIINGLVNPRMVAIDNRGFAYVTGQGNNIVSIIDIATQSVIDSVAGFNSPNAVLINKDSSRIFIGDNGTTNTIRLEYNPLSSEKITSFDNVFQPDGLNHILRLIYRENGIEVYQDYNYLGFAPWRDPRGAVFSYGPFTTLNCPIKEINTCIVSPFPDTLFAYPDNGPVFNTGDDSPKWWDLFIGLPNNVDMFFKRVAINELPSIDHPDTIDFGISTSGFDVQKYNFDFVNQVRDNQQEYVKNSLSVPVKYESMNPVSAGGDEAFKINDLFISYQDNIVTDITLNNKTYLSLNEVLFLEDVQNFFKLPKGVALTMDSLFTINGWSPTLHSDYYYDNYNRIFTNYQIYSQQVLTYLALLPFINLVEEKFKVLVTQFIPIVINFSSFGQRITQLGKDKIHYPKITLNTAVNLVGAPARGSFRIVHGSDNDYLNLTNNLVIGIQLPSFTIVNLGTFNWINTNSLTAEFIANSITTTYGPNIKAVWNKNVVAIEIDYSWFLATYGYDINLCPLVVTANSNVVVTEVVGFADGTPSFSVPGAPTIAVVTNGNPYPQGDPFQYSYFASEAQKETYIYFASELKQETYIYYKTEENSTPY
jgi:YVTN family beta-propeller protein